MRTLPLVLLALPLLLPAASVPAPAFLAPAVDAPDAPAGTVSRGAEPVIMALPSGRILVGDTAGIHVSSDGGASWSRRSIDWPPGAFADGLPLARDAAGTLYTADTQGQIISVASSTDDGLTWTVTSPLVEAWGIADRPWVAAGRAGEVLVVYYAPGVGERCAYSTDGGRTFLTRTLVVGGPSNAGSVALDAEGRVWYAQGFNVVRWPQPCAGTPLVVPSPMAGAQIFDPLALSPDGDAFVTRPTAGNREMVLRGMHDMDPSTRKDVVVSPPGVRSNTFGTVAVKPDGTEVAVAWYGSATAGNPSSSAFPGSWDVYVARVAGFWTSSPTVTVTKVTSVPNHVGGFCMQGVTCSGDRDLLDYFGVAYDEAGNVHVAYGHDGSTSRAEVRYAKVS